MPMLTAAGGSRRCMRCSFGTSGPPRLLTKPIPPARLPVLDKIDRPRPWRIRPTRRLVVDYAAFQDRGNISRPVLSFVCPTSPGCGLRNFDQDGPDCLFS